MRYFVHVTRMERTRNRSEDYGRIECDAVYSVGRYQCYLLLFYAAHGAAVLSATTGPMYQTARRHIARTIIIFTFREKLRLCTKSRMFVGRSMRKLLCRWIDNIKTDLGEPVS
jgi:hypothetical protein